MVSKVKLKNYLIIFVYFLCLFIILLIFNKISEYNQKKIKEEINAFQVNKEFLEEQREAFKKTPVPTKVSTKINFWHNLYWEERQILQEVIQDFQKIYPSIEVLENNKGYWSQIFKNVTSALTVNKQPNLVVSYPDHIGFYHRSKKVLPLDKFIKQDNQFQQDEKDEGFVDGYFETLKIDGQKESYYYLPFLKTTEIMFYNKAFLKKAYEYYEKLGPKDKDFQCFQRLVSNEGEIKKPLLTWNDMGQICRRLTKYKTKDLVPIVVDSESNLFIISTKQKGIIYPDEQKQTEIFLKQKGIKEILKKFKDFYDQRYFTLSKLTGEDNIQKLIKDENIVFYITSTRRMDSLCAIKGFVPSFASIPIFDNGLSKNILQGSNVNLFYSKDTKENYASWFFLQYLTSSKVYKKFLEKNKLFNITRNYKDTDEITKVMEQATDKLKDKFNLSDELTQFRKDFFKQFILKNGEKQLNDVKNQNEQNFKQDFFVTSVFEKSDFFRNIIMDLFIDVLKIDSTKDDFDSNIEAALQTAINRILAK